MASLIDTLRSVLCCCLKDQRQQSGQYQQLQHQLPDETTLLITPNEPTISYGDISYQDQQKLQQRLGTIVRSKEGKMVNVGSHIPFNLHNQVIAEDRTISRSNSGSLDLSSSRYQNNNYSHHHHPSNNSNNNHNNLHPDYNHSPLSRSRSRSSSSSPSQHDGYNDDECSSSTSRRRRVTNEQPRPTPILNVRLVGYNKPPPSATMRGRARERGMHPSGLPAPKSPIPKDAAASTSGAASKGAEAEVGDGVTGAAEGKDGVSPVRAVKKKPALVLDDVSSIAVSWDD